MSKISSCVFGLCNYFKKVKVGLATHDIVKIVKKDRSNAP